MKPKNLFYRDEREPVRDMRQKGNNFVEYALMLALVVGIGWGLLGSYGDGIPGIFGSAAELLQAGSKSTEQKVYDRHMKWLKDTLLKGTDAGFQSFADFMGGPNGTYFDQRKGPDFTTEIKNKNGLIDSDSLSKFVGQIDSSALENDSWAMVGYKENGQLYYAVAIYSPDKNGGIKLADQPVRATVKTDVYLVDPDPATNATNAIRRLENNRLMQVAENTLNGNTYHVLRDR